MDDLFNQLKAEPPVLQTSFRSLPSQSITSNKTVSNSEDAEKAEKVLPTSSTNVKEIFDIEKSSVSEQKKISKSISDTKRCVVLVERKKVRDSIDASSPNSLNKYETNKKNDKEISLDKSQKKDNINRRKLKFVKGIPPLTKAQKKQFDQPRSENEVNQLKKFGIKSCAVLLKRIDKSIPIKSHIDIKKEQKKDSPDGRKGIKRKSDSQSDSSLEKIPRKTKQNINNVSSSQNFFIKLPAQNLQPKKHQNYVKIKNFNNDELQKKNLVKQTKSLKIAEKSKVIKKKKNQISSPFLKTTKAGLSRFQLLKMFGSRFFRSYVKIERCKHPMMVIFESNALARQKKAKKIKKTKNLSVSFNEQVEIFGDSDSDTSNTDSDDFSFLRTTSVGNRIKIEHVSSTPMPARLKRVENGKVVDDIDIDPSLFLDPEKAKSSTPDNVNRKKKEKKSFSPLKGDDAPSPRREHLKLANEKMPPSGLRRIADDEVDDADDEEDEYIVPIEIKPRRTSSTSITSLPLVNNLNSNTSSSRSLIFTSAGKNDENSSKDSELSVTIVIEDEEGDDDGEELKGTPGKSRAFDKLQGNENIKSEKKCTVSNKQNVENGLSKSELDINVEASITDIIRLSEMSRKSDETDSVKSGTDLESLKLEKKLKHQTNEAKTSTQTIDTDPTLFKDSKECGKSISDDEANENSSSAIETSPNLSLLNTTSLTLSSLNDLDESVRDNLIDLFDPTEKPMESMFPENRNSEDVNNDFSTLDAFVEGTVEAEIQETLTNNIKIPNILTIDNIVSELIDASALQHNISDDENEN